MGINLCQGNPYDGHTLKQAIATTEQITQVGVTDCFVDKGYRGHGCADLPQVHTAGSSTRKLTRTQKKRHKRRSAVEPKIGHLKSDNRMGRCFLRGLMGDKINAVLAAAGSNLQKLLRAIEPALILWLWSRIKARIGNAFQSATRSGTILRPIQWPRVGIVLPSKPQRLFQGRLIERAR